ncbi:hypothetical protein [Streptomyces sp. CBMA156]|uniref:hypothetical protein n=1 Tax=Streptomyces sp. CBMA156 TaxID=1930280 RepID=UPI001662093D|nr:hypothetical protein [Streptomyces sp. CBMA156]
MSAATTEDGTIQGRNFHTLAGGGAVLYIAECVELDALKVGITSQASRTSRVRVHARHGWRTTAEIPFDHSRHALIAEQAVLAFLRACGARETLRREQLPQGGYTETIASPDRPVSVPAACSKWPVPPRESWKPPSSRPTCS